MAAPVMRNWRKQVMNTPQILITGATGKTGTPAIKELRQQGIAVRAMASKKDERTAALTELGRRGRGREFSRLSIASEGR